MTKHELSQLYYLEREITKQEEQLSALDAEAKRTTSQLTGMPRSTSHSDRLGSIVAQIADLTALIILNLEKRIYQRNQIMRYIMTIDDSLMRQILISRYVDCKEWWQVAEDIGGNNTADSVRKQHSRFLGRS